MQLGTNELERMKEERKQLTDELKSENEALEKVKAERRNLEAEILQMKLNRDTSNRKLRCVKLNMKCALAKGSFPIVPN